MPSYSRKYIALLFLLNPLLSLWVAIKRYKLKKYRWVVYCVAGFVGFTLNFSMESADGFRHTEDFANATRLSWGDFLMQLKIILERSTYTVDYYVTVINFLVSRIFSDPSYVFAVHALIFTFFYLKVINLAYDEFGGKYRLQQLFLFGLIFLFPITQLNALRYPIALWVWSYGTLYYLKSGQLRYLLITASASLVHFGISPATMVVLGYHFLGKRTSFYFYFYIISFFVAIMVSFDDFINLTEGLGAGIEKRASGYASDEYLERRIEGLTNVNWYVIWRYKLFNWFITFGIVYLYFTRRKLRFDEFQETLLAFIFLYASYINFVIDIPSFGGRQRWFLWIIVLFALYRAVSLNYHLFKVRIIGYIAILPILLYSLVEIRAMFYFLSIDTIFSNPIIVLIGQSELTLDKIIKQ